MKKIEIKPLPHKIGSAQIANPELKTVTMLLMENIVSLKEQLEAAQNAILGLQRRLMHE